LKSQSIVDGEVIVVHEGRTNFSELQADLAKGRQDCTSSTPSICFTTTA
jgi:bifunctional non-homologous end joining protein LigD